MTQALLLTAAGGLLPSGAASAPRRGIAMERPAGVVASHLIAKPLSARPPPRPPHTQREASTGTAPPETSAPPPPSPPLRDWLTSTDGTLHTSVGIYGDCGGRRWLTHAEADIDICMAGRTYFVGHNPGVFTPLLHLSVGDALVWYDHGGGAHHLRIVAVRNWRNRGNAVPAVVRPGIVAQFQTCVDVAGAYWRILDAVPA